MKDKILNILNHFVKQINSDGLNTGFCRDVVKKMRDYVRQTEIELSDRELDTIVELRKNEPLRMMLIMTGVYLPLIIEDSTIRLLFMNPEIRQKNLDISLIGLLLKLQRMLDDTYWYAQQVKISRQIYTVKELKDLQKEINIKWQKKKT